ncbi:MAG: hypothetical protein MZV65_37200 [Chromatiales bacterium]|nr:hypothetical protein [Chromatiales bacterium]
MNNLLDIAFLYGVPLFGLVVVYVVRMALELKRYVKAKESNLGLVSVVSLKMAIAATPMFFS